MQIGQAGRRVEGGRWKQIFSWDVKLCLRVILKSVVVLSVGIPSVACTPAIWRGSDGVEDRLGCCLTLSSSSPLSPICLGNHAPRCREKGRGGQGGRAQRKIQLTERQKLGEKKGPVNGQNTRKVTDFSRRNGNSLIKSGQKCALRTMKSFVKRDIHFLP